MNSKIILIFISLFLVSGVFAMSDIAVFQGQYFEGNEFQQGTYEFKFDFYDAETGGNLIHTHTETLSTGFWGQWKIEIPDVSDYCNDTTKDHFVEITIDGNAQPPRRRLTQFMYLRKNIDDSTTGDLTISSILNFLLGGNIQELAGNFLINKGLEVTGVLNVTGSIYSDNKLVCLEDGTNCAGGGGGTSYVSFISTVDGDLGKNDRYLPLGTDGGISASSTEMSWIIDRDMTITGILWDSASNSRTKTSAITLFSGSSKNSLSATGLSVDIQGVVSGSSLSFNESFAQGDAAAIKYESGGRGGDIEDLSITLIGTYD